MSRHTYKPLKVTIPGTNRGGTWKQLKIRDPEERKQHNLRINEYKTLRVFPEVWANRERSRLKYLGYADIGCPRCGEYHWEHVGYSEPRGKGPLAPRYRLLRIACTGEVFEEVVMNTVTLKRLDDG